jgi:hypothetical protein
VLDRSRTHTNRVSLVHLIETSSRSRYHHPRRREPVQVLLAVLKWLLAARLTRMDRRSLRLGRLGRRRRGGEWLLHSLTTETRRQTYLLPLGLLGMGAGRRVSGAVGPMLR